MITHCTGTLERLDMCEINLDFFITNKARFLFGQLKELSLKKCNNFTSLLPECDNLVRLILEKSGNLSDLKRNFPKLKTFITETIWLQLTDSCKLIGWKTFSYAT